MHLLTCILIFTLGAIGAAMKGDYSGTIVIGKVFKAIGIFFFFTCIFTGFSTDGAGNVFIFSIIMMLIGFALTAKEEK